MEAKAKLLGISVRESRFGLTGVETEAVWVVPFHSVGSGSEAKGERELLAFLSLRFLAVDTM